MKKNEMMANEALRVLAFAYRSLKPSEKSFDEKLENDLIFIGLMGLIDPPRETVKPAVQACRRAKIKPVMITGDHRITAEVIAKDIGILTEGSITLDGQELDQMSDPELIKAVDKISVYARVSPRHKLRIIRALKKKGHIVAMTGDGVNDAPAIKEADIGISMGQTGTDIAKEASAMILRDDNFATIVGAIEEGRGIYNNIRKFIRYLLGCNIGEVLTMFLASLAGMPIPLLPVQILWVNLVTDGLPAMALGIDKNKDGLMNHPPRDPKESIFAQGLGMKILIRGIQIGLSTIIVFWVGLRLGESLELARTMAFATLVFTQLLHVFDCRSEERSAFDIGFFTNFYLDLAVFSSVFLELMVIYLPFFQDIFKTVSLQPIHWLIVLAGAGWQTVINGSKYLLGNIGFVRTVNNTKSR